MRRATSFHPLVGISAGVDALRPRSASDADDWPDMRSSTARRTCILLVLRDRVTPTTLRSAAAAIVQRGVRRVPPCFATNRIGLPLFRGLLLSAHSRDSRVRHAADSKP